MLNRSLPNFIYLFILIFSDRVCLSSVGCPGTHSVDQAGLDNDLPASASQDLGLEQRVPTSCLDFKFVFKGYFISDGGGTHF